MKTTYTRPDIWVEELALVSSLANQVTSITGNAGITLGGVGYGGLRAGENNLWDDEEEEEDDTVWDKL